MTDALLLTTEQVRIARMFLNEQITRLGVVNDAARRAYRDRLPPNIEFEVNQREAQIHALGIVAFNLETIATPPSPIDTARKVPSDDSAGVVTAAVVEAIRERAPTARRGKVKH